MLIELANRQLSLARSEGSAMRLFGFAVDASTAAPWIVAVVLLGGGLLMVRRFWPRVGEAWGAVDAHLRLRAQT
jgi:hypothetical protein